jgi:hypothetical protein
MGVVVARVIWQCISEVTTGREDEEGMWCIMIPMINQLGWSPVFWALEALAYIACWALHTGYYPDGFSALFSFLVSNSGWVSGTGLVFCDGWAVGVSRRLGFVRGIGFCMGLGAFHVMMVRQTTLARVGLSGTEPHT